MLCLGPVVQAQQGNKGEMLLGHYDVVTDTDGSGFGRDEIVVE